MAQHLSFGRRPVGGDAVDHAADVGVVRVGVGDDLEVADLGAGRGAQAEGRRRKEDCRRQVAAGTRQTSIATWHFSPNCPVGPSTNRTSRPVYGGLVKNSIAWVVQGEKKAENRPENCSWCGCRIALT